jgi:hypothetical protein
VGQRVGDLHEGLGPEGIVNLRPIDRDLGDAITGVLIAHVLEALKPGDWCPDDLAGVLDIPDRA